MENKGNDTHRKMEIDLGLETYIGLEKKIKKNNKEDYLFPFFNKIPCHYMLKKREYPLYCSNLLRYFHMTNAHR